MMWDQGAVEISPSRRGAVRRGVRLDCDLHSHAWTGGVRFAATDVSPYGLWIETLLPLEPDALVLVRFTALAPLLTAGRLVAPPPAGLGVVIPFPGAFRAHAHTSALAPDY